MAVGEAYYPGITAGDAAAILPDGSVETVVVPPNSFFQVFELADTANVTPLVVRTESGLTDTKVPVGALPILPDVYVKSPNFAHRWVSGALTFRRDSNDAKDKAVAEAVAAAQAAVSAVPVEVERVAATGAFKGEPGKDGAAVLPTDTAIKQAIESPTSATSTALKAAYVPKYYDDGNNFTDRGAVQTIARQLPSPVGLQHNIFSVVSGLGDNSNFRGVTGGMFQARDLPTVTQETKGVLYGGQFVAAPRVDRNNVPFDDVVGVSIENQGIARGTDALYFGRKRDDKAANPNGEDWANIIQNDAYAPNFIRSIGKHEIGISLSGATITTAAIRLGSGQSVAWASGSDPNVLVQGIRMTGTNTLRFYEGGLDIRADKGAYFGARAVLSNNTPLRGIRAGVTNETDLIKLNAQDAVSLGATDAFQIFATGAIAVKNDKGFQAQNAAGDAYLELVRLTASNNMVLYGTKATLLASGGLVLADVSVVPSAPNGGVVLYSEGGVLKAKRPGGAITTITP